MNGQYRALLIALFTLLSSHTALGQRTYAIGVSGGAAIPVGKLSDAQNTGYHGMVVLAIGSAELPIGVRFDGIYNNLVKNTPPVPEGAAATSSDLRIAAGLSILYLPFLERVQSPTCWRAAGF